MIVCAWYFLYMHAMCWLGELALAIARASRWRFISINMLTLTGLVSAVHSLGSTVTSNTVMV